MSKYTRYSLPGGQGAAQPSDFGDRAVDEDLDQLGGVVAGGGQSANGVGQAQLLVSPPGGSKLTVGIADGKTFREPGQHGGGEPVGAAAQQPADLVQRVSLVAAAPACPLTRTVPRWRAIALRGPEAVGSRRCC